MPDRYDWEKIRAEYIADPTTSFRKLAAKHGVSRFAISDRSKAEGWPEQRNQYISKTRTELQKKMVASSGREVDNILKARDLLTVRALEMAATATRPSDIINLPNALQILARMTGVQSDLDTQEQKARIASIEARAGVQDEEESGGTILIPEKEWDDDE